MKHLYYVRHGESEANAKHIWGTDAPLTKKGIQQAEHAGVIAASEHFMPDVIISSPLLRAHKTAEKIAAALGYPLDKIIIDAQLQERLMGDIEGTPMNGVEPGTAGYKTIDSIPTVETFKELQARAARVLASLKERPEDTILIAGHAAFGRCLRRVVAGRPSSDEYDAEFKQIPNAEIFQLI